MICAALDIGVRDVRRRVRRNLWRWQCAAATTALLVISPCPTAALPPSGGASCSGCHAPEALAGIVPDITGRPAEEIIAAMTGFKTGARPATVMDRIAKGFSDAEIRAIAEWLATQRDQAAQSTQP